MSEKDIIFLGMDIYKGTESFINSMLFKKECEGMNEGQLAAYKMGVSNALSLLKTILEVDGDSVVIVNIPGAEDIEEFDLDDLTRRLTK